MAAESGKSAGTYWKKHLRSLQVGLGIGLAVGLVVVLVGFSDEGFIARTELLSLDMRYRARPQIPIHPEVGNIDYDDASLALFGSWPWPRYRQVALVTMMDHYDARAVGYDVFFTEKNDIAVLDGRLKKFVNEASAGKPTQADIAHAIKSSIRDYDRDFERAIAHAGNIYLGYFVEEPDAAVAKGGLQAINAHVEKTKQTPEYLKKAESIEALDPYKVPMTPELEKSIFKMGDITPPLAPLTRVSAGAGFAQIVKDLDHTVRLYPLFMYYDSGIYPSIGCAMLAKIMDAPLESWRITPGEQVDIPNALVPGETDRVTIRIPVNANGQMLMNWAGRYDDVMLHVPFIYVSEYYAYYTAKNASKNFPAAVESYEPLRREIINLIDDELMAPEQIAHRIAEEIALSHVASPMLKAGRTPADVMSAMPPPARTDTAMSILNALSAGLRADSPARIAVGAAEKIDAAWKSEIERNVAWFKSKGRLAEVEPLFFPPTRKLQWAGSQKDFSPLDLENKIFMVGLTGVGTIDLNPMPFESVHPMVGLHSNSLNTIMVQKFLHFPKKYWRYPLDFGFSMLTAVAGALTTPFIGFLIVLLITAAYTYGVYWAFAVHGQWIYWFEPMLAILLTFVAIVVYHFILAQKEKGRVRAIFAAMVSPSVLKLMEDNPDRFSLTGVRKPATMLFSAIEKFGKVTTGVPPDELSGVLSIYLTPTSEIIMDYGGYIDKYEGHVIMADFGVPLDDPGHAWKCSFSTIEQQHDIAAFQFFVKAHYGADVHVSMGVNSGYVSAGNMGSEKKMQYTVMGDAVNMSARFRPANGIYDTRIITGEATVPLVKDYLELRLLDKLLAKGKTIPTTIYEIQGWKPEAYMSLRGGDPVPSSLVTRWSKCPGEKIFGYHKFWTVKEKQTGHPMAKRIREFFESHLQAAEERIKLEGRFTVRKFHDELLAVHAEASILLGKPVNGAAKPGASWDAALDAWMHSADSARAALEPARPDPGSADPAALTAFATTIGRAGVLVSKLHALKQRLSIPAESQSLMERLIADMHETIEKTAGSAENIQPISEDDIASRRGAYRSAAETFCGELAADPKQYHEMMSVVGDSTPDMKKARDLFQAGVHLHWERKWDESIAKFLAVLELIPGDGPSTSYIERVEGYKSEPPVETWQGEFVQKKK